MKKQRKRCTPEEKVAILRRHLVEQVSISELCGAASSLRSSTGKKEYLANDTAEGFVQ
jgi:transposase-like protein